VCEEYKQETGHEVIEDFSLWEPCHKILLGNGVMGWENVGGDGSMVRLVAIVDKGDQ